MRTTYGQRTLSSAAVGASRKQYPEAFKKRRGRLPGDRVEDALASEFRQWIREGMALYEAAPGDVVDQQIGRKCNRTGKWISLQLAPSRDLFAHNARELVQLMLYCKKANAYRARVGGLNLDKWFVEMQTFPHGKFRFLTEPLPRSPIAIFASPNEVVRFAEMMAGELSTIAGVGSGNREAIKNRIQRWFDRSGGEAAWYATWDALRILVWRKPQVNGIDIDPRKFQSEMIAVVDLLWQGNEGYETFQASALTQAESFQPASGTVSRP